MAINLYGMPLTKDLAPLAVMAHWLEGGTPGTFLIYQEVEFVEALTGMVDKAEDRQKELAAAVEKEFSYKGPTPEKCASLGAFLAKCFEVGLKAAVNFLLDVVEFVAALPGKVLNAAFKGLFSGPAGFILIAVALIAGIICLKIFL